MKYLFLYILACLFTVNAVAQSIKPTVAVLGDSYSTFEKYIPDTNKTYYTTTDWSKTGVVNVKQTWWWQVIKKAGFKLGANDSYKRGLLYPIRDIMTRTMPTVHLLQGFPVWGILISSSSSVESMTIGQTLPIGEYKYGDFKRADLYTYRPALAKLIELAQEHYPNVTLYFIISDDLKTEIVESTKVVCEHYGIKYVQLQGIEKESGHPTVKGMETIANQVLTLIK